jgi:PAS domain S-box-containing protein
MVELTKLEKDPQINERFMGTLREMVQRASNHSDLLELMRTAASIAAEALAVEYCQIWELLPESQGLALKAGIGLGIASDSGSMIEDVGYALAEQAIVNGSPVIVNDMKGDERFRLSVDLQNSVIQCGLSVIIPGKNQPYGAVSVQSIQPKEFNSSQVFFLEHLSVILAFAIVQLELSGRETRLTTQTSQLQNLVEKLETELSDREAIEKALRNDETLLNSLFESAPDASILTDNSGSIIRLNARAEVVFGYEKDELLGKSIDLLLPQRFRDLHLSHRADFFKKPYTRSMGIGLQLYALRKDGIEFPVDIMLSPIKIEGEKLILCAIRDATEHKQFDAENNEVNQRLIESVETERLYLAQELHDGPIQDLYVIIYQLSSLESTFTNQLPLEFIQSTETNIQKIINALRAICGELRPPTLSPFGLEKAIRSHIEKVQLTNPDLNIHLNLSSDKKILNERVRLALFRIYQNIISNVLRHSDAKNLEIILCMDVENVELQIKDDGRGFILPKRWIEFVREGHLGLAGAVERAQAVGARLKIDSTPGQGTTVRVTAPLVDPLDSSS